MAEFGQKHLDLMDKVGTDIQLISPRPFHAMHSLKPHKVVKEWNCFVNDVIAQTVRALPHALHRRRRRCRRGRTSRSTRRSPSSSAASTSSGSSAA